MWTGIQDELVLGRIARRTNQNGDFDGAYLEDRVTFSEDKLMDSDSKVVMMAWEKPLMEAYAKAVCSGGGHILNIGFGMGLVDTAIQQYAPVTHTIVEAHPEVYKRVLHTGWGDKDNVKIIFGRWQDVLSQLESYDGNTRILVALLALCTCIFMFYVSWTSAHSCASVHTHIWNNNTTTTFFWLFSLWDDLSALSCVCMFFVLELYVQFIWGLTGILNLITPVELFNFHCSFFTNS